MKKIVRKLSEEGIPKESDLAYDMNHPNYFLPDISKEVHDYLEDQVMGNPKPNPGDGSPIKAVIKDQSEQVTKDLADYDILEDVQNFPANVTIGELFKENLAYKNQLRPSVTRRRRKFCFPDIKVS